MVPSINSYPDQCLAHPFLNVFEYIYINQESCCPATNVPFHSMIIWFALTFKILILRHDWESALYQSYGWFGFWPWLVGLPTKFPDTYPKWSQNFPFHYIHLLWSAGKGQFTCLNRRPGHRACMFDAYVWRRDTVYKFHVAVIPESPCLLGRSVSEQMGLVQRMDSLECPTPSRKMHMRTDEVNISLKEGHTPYCAATLSEIAIPLMEPCRWELEWMEANGIIEKVTEPTDWCARMVPVPKKSGEVRICVDLKCLNRVVRREHYPLYTLEDIAPRLAGSTVFSSLHAASGF